MKKIDKLILAGLIGIYLHVTWPMVAARPYGGDRVGQTAGTIRTYCLQPDRSFLKGAYIHYGDRPFNQELTVFEWIQGALARGLDKNCESVEMIAQSAGIIFSILTIIAAFFLVSQAFGPAAGVIPALMAAGCLSLDELWMKYGPMIMVENRAIAFALLAILFARRRSATLSGVFWTLTLLQKPQGFVFFSVLWIGCELVELFDFSGENPVHSPGFGKWFKQRQNVFVACILGSTAGSAYFIWSYPINMASDLPWIQWTGPRYFRWFFGDPAERLTFGFFKSQVFHWIHKSQLIAFIACAVPLVFFKKIRPKEILGYIVETLPFLAGIFVLTALFLNVFKAHEYYALPLNVTGACVAAILFGRLVAKSKVTAWVFIPLILIQGVQNITKVKIYFSKTQSPQHFEYVQDWNEQVFPKENSFVVMAVEGWGPELYELYKSKQRGFQWCAQNEKFAPRAFWKKEGVEYVAWSDGSDTRKRKWKVRTIQEELQRARMHGWSSDVDDVWSAHTMEEWSKIGGRKLKDPCRNPVNFDPRTWGAVQTSFYD